MKKRGSGSLIAAVLLAAVLFAAIYGAWSFVETSLNPPAGSQGKSVTLVIADGESTQQIADDLQTKGLIKNALTFSAWARIKGLDKQLQAGAYKLTGGMTLDQIIARLQHGLPDEKSLLIIDGYRLEQIAAAATEAGLTKFSSKDFLNYTHHPDQFPDNAKYPILKGLSSMEGLLFPDTYLVPTDYTTTQVIDMMLGEFTQQLQQHKLVATAQQHQLTQYQMIILASIVQRESGNTIDMPLIAGIYWNRVLKPNAETNGLLQADPTVEYARDTDQTPKKYWINLGSSGTGSQVDPGSPWNTYTHAGWPPTPISSPNLAALTAASNPGQTSCYYFLTRPDTKRIVCANTGAQFQQLLQQYLG